MSPLRQPARPDPHGPAPRRPEAAPPAPWTTSVAAEIDRRMAGHLAALPGLPERLRGAALDATAAGKRMRPVLLCLVAGPDRAEAAFEAGVALEMVHSASLVLDDLPSMDDAALRRGRPTTHRRFGEATAILSAVGLITHATRILAELPGVPEARRVELVAILSRAMGWEGLCAGQELDVNGFGAGDTPPLTGDRRVAEAARVARINSLKTSVLLSAALEMGAVIAGRAPDCRAPLARLGEDLGQAFQIADDLGDLFLDAQVAGKDCGQDAGKATYAAIFGPEAAVARCRMLLAAVDGGLDLARIDRAVFAPMIDRLFAPVLQRASAPTAAPPAHPAALGPLGGLGA
ncbi:polyprenyl synthetase family protein [Frigidibacter sp. MR17.24]|uniref:polyprenyl synthetase family protein n=1 Tax=Frigidibacter sp. MR17.24 TaxID=3127345 RepID=UPI003012F991